MSARKLLHKPAVRPDPGILPIVLAFFSSLAPLLVFFGCACLRETKIPEPALEQISRRVFDIDFDDSIPLSISLDKTCLPAEETELRISIEYVERANVAGDVAPDRSEFLNVYFVACGSVRDQTFFATRTQVVIYIWDHAPEAGIKTCHQWILFDTDVDDTVEAVQAESITENRWNFVQEVRQIPISSIVPGDYSDLCRRCVEYMLRRLGVTSPFELFRSWQL